MYVETQKRAFESEIRCARIHRDAERLDFSSRLSAHLALNGFDVFVVICFSFYLVARTRQRVFACQSRSRDVLLRPFSDG